MISDNNLGTPDAVKNGKTKTELKLNKKNKKIKDVIKPIDFSKFDPITGEKTAGQEEQKRLAHMELSADARKTRTSERSIEDTLKDSSVGGSLSFLTASSAISKDSNKIKALTALRKKGLIGVVGAGIAGALSVKKQKSEYNRQQGARENIAGKETGRALAYKDMLKRKYNLNDN